jgi:hypothetical protein
MATYAIVYGTSSGAIRRIIADDGGEVSTCTMRRETWICVTQPEGFGYHPILPGESVLIVTNNSGTPHQWSDWVTQLTNAGVTVTTPTCALIDDTNTVKQIICADPAIDSAPSGYTMVECYSPVIAVGCTYSATTGLFTIPSYTVPAVTNPHTGVTSLSYVVAAQAIPNPNAT